VTVDDLATVMIVDDLATIVIVHDMETVVDDLATVTARDCCQVTNESFPLPHNGGNVTVK